ncbi:site-specific integrase [Aquabacterium sp. J223]|uniref:site-specific integrase n=1 Tax=Aquabacterium sp. J223 TaxID=2898431 RepID=UPI0021AD9151|nr:site-specific integrase [Aquabacterium sp. J223]UUX94574.1 site-specific integrase [Aquabacterium sp. J223]
MPSTHHITRRGAVYYFRARVPKELISAYGRKMVSVSLKTGDEREAHRRAVEHKEQLEREFTALARQTRRLVDGYSGAIFHLSDADIEALCLRFRSSMLADDELQRIRGLDASARQLDLDILSDWMPLLRDNYARGFLGDVYRSLDAFLTSIDLRVPRGSAYERLARRFQQAEIEVYDAILRRRRGESVDIPLLPLDALTYDDVFRLWKGWKPNRPLKTVRAFEQAFEELKARTTATTPAMLTKQDAVSFRNRFIDSGKASRRTVAKCIGFLRAAFECARKDGKISVNPFDGVEVALDEVELKSRTRLPFTVAELNTIFTGPVYQPGFVPRKSLGASQYWLPLLSLFQGARLEELAQLHAEDVRKDEEHGHYLVIHAEGQRQVKNSSSVRQVPLHEELVRLGFLDYVASVKAGRLFPMLKRDAYNKLGTTFSTWFGRYLHQLGITDPSRVFHSFRHSFVAVCKQKAASGIPPEVREAIIGHTPTNEIVEAYGDIFYPLEPQVAAMRNLQIKGLDLTHLHPK